jgi:hypothetical protein
MRSNAVGVFTCSVPGEFDIFVPEAASSLSGGECLMHGLFGEIQISEEAHERRQNPDRF